MSTDRIPVAGPWITDLEVEYAADAARHGWYESAGDYPLRFEAAVAKYVGTEFAVATPHCTSAIHLALAALGIGPGDEVIVPDATWIASAAPITYVGATPVFADVDPETWCIRSDSIGELLSKRTRAVLAVDLYGSMPDWTAVRQVCKDQNVPIIEDAAEAIGSLYQGGSAGSFGDAGVFSFHGSKTVATGEGGMLVTSSREIYDRALFLRDHGRTPGDKWFFNTEVAFKYRMSAVQAAIGLAQIERVEELVHRKREIFGWYKDYLGGVHGITLNAEPKGTRNSYWMVTVLFDQDLEIDKRSAAEYLWEAGIDVRPFFHPLSDLPAYQDSSDAERARAENTVSYDVCGRGLNLPSAMSLTKEQVAHVSKTLKQLLRSLPS